jgi:PIN domain nuclease of toxin-antitoxin system
MIYLLDTHYLIWTITDTGKLSGKVRERITNPDNRIMVSTISFWEISLKSSLGKLEIKGFSPEELPGFCVQMGFDIVPLSARDSSTYHQLKATYHKDPFDRMLIWTAITNGYTFISVDANVKRYVSEGLKIFTGK